HQPACEDEPDRVGELKGEHDVRVIDLAPAELRLQRRLQDADHLTIDVVDRRGEEQQAADRPTDPADARRNLRVHQKVGFRRWMANSRWPSRSATVGRPLHTSIISSNRRAAAASIGSSSAMMPLTSTSMLSAIDSAVRRFPVILTTGAIG